MSHSVCIFCVFSSVSLLAASHCISIVAVSEFVLDGMHISFCIFPLCISLSLSFCACGHGLFVSVCLSFAPIFVCITEWLSHCVHFSLSLCSACLQESRQTRKAPMIHTLSQTQSVSEDLRKLFSLLLPLNRPTANIFHREMLIFIFLTFSNTSVDTEVLYLEYLFCDLNISKPYFLKKKSMYKSNFL